VAAVIGALLLAACARTVAVAPPGPPLVADERVGYASWYGHPYHGRRTASGEVYDMNDLTAAHRTLPLGTRLLVTSLDTGQAVEVRINDRGPFVEGRILDLSYAAARVLGADRQGLVRVRLQVIAPLDGMVVPAGALPRAAWAVQLGAFTSRGRAEGLRDALAREGEAPTVSEVEIGGETIYRVRLGAFPDRSSAGAAARRLAGRGYRPLVVER
jgi:rare lipoprotein A